MRSLKEKEYLWSYMEPLLATFTLSPILEDDFMHVVNGTEPLAMS